MATGQAKSTGYDLYYAALDADQRFHDELVRVYGKKNAGDARYFKTHTDAGVIAAREAKHAVDKAWRCRSLYATLLAMRIARGE